ncbi:MAG: hypothetical protein HY870_15630 [Chloroflexi bacterium]|nr:hypothetical protein [Chloroflexota bacterium]
MSTVQEIEQAVSQLAPRDLARFRKWFDVFDAKAWDKQFERDVRAGKLDKLADQALADFHAGKFREL